MALCKIVPDFTVLKDRDINIVRRLIRDVSWVVAAVDQLRVVDKILKNEEFEEHKKSSDSVNDIISCLRTLDHCRLQLHEELEIQSIRGFIMKQTYVNLPKQIRAMIEAAVHSAQNEAEKHYTKGKNEETFLNADLERMREEILQIEAENQSLPVMQKKIEDQESKTIEEFNMRLKYKLDLKEKLRRLRERIRQESQMSVHTETSILKMKDGLIIERAKAKKEMEFYQSQIEEVKKRREVWVAKVATVKPEYDEVMADLKASEKLLAGIKSSMTNERHKMTTSTRLTGTYTSKILREKIVLDSLMNKKNRILEDLTFLKVEFENDFGERKRSYHELELKVMFERHRTTELENNVMETSKVLYFFLEIEENTRKLWKSSKDKLDMLQNQLSKYEDDLVRCLNEQADIKVASMQIDDTLGFRLDQLKHHITTLIDTLNLKKKVRIEMEDLEENILKNLEEVKEQKDTFEVTTNMFMKEKEKEYEGRLSYVKGLQKEIKDTVRGIKVGVGDVMNMQDDNEDECIKKETLIKEIEVKAEKQDKIYTDIHTKFEVLSRPFKELAFEYQNCLKNYSSIYRRNSLELNLVKQLTLSQLKAEKELMKLQKKKEKLEQGTKILNDKYYNLLSKNIQEVEEIEGQIYMQVCRYKFLKLENNILKEAIEDYKQKLEGITEYNQEQMSLQHLLRRLIKQLKRGFTKKQMKIDEIGELALERDTPFIGQFSDVLDVINYNISLVTSVLRQIAKEMDKLNSKWGCLEKMRPIHQSAVKCILFKISQSSMKPESDSSLEIL